MFPYEYAWCACLLSAFVVIDVAAARHRFLLLGAKIIMFLLSLFFVGLCVQVEQFCYWVYTQQNFLNYFKVVHDGMPFWVIKVGGGSVPRSSVGCLFVCAGTVPLQGCWVLLSPRWVNGRMHCAHFVSDHSRWRRRFLRRKKSHSDARRKSGRHRRVPRGERKPTSVAQDSVTAS